jgi:RNA polymerase sigma-70 factor (ECF subfamily)
MSPSDLHELAARLARGEEAAFAQLYDTCADRLHHYVAVRLGSSPAAADVVQNTFLRAVKSRRRFRSVENPIAYLFQVARNEATRALSRPTVFERPIGSYDDFVESDACGSSDDADMVAAALLRLHADDRELVELKIFGGLTFREIADVTGMPQATVATRYRRALESLRPWLAKQFR